MASARYYAYLIPGSGESGIAGSWKECENIVSGTPGARYRGFRTKEEAEEWLRSGAEYGGYRDAFPGVYFDAGTGRGKGVEVQVTDERGRSLLSDLLPEGQLTSFGTERLSPEHTNNYGELLACKYAIEIARKRGVPNVYGDSALVINSWSQGSVRETEVDGETVSLVKEVSELREVFESEGGVIERISGRDNPADLGFH